MGLLAELGRLSVAAWSPGGSGGGYIATGTYAGSVDTSFTDAVGLELLSVDIQRSKLVPVATLPAPSKFGSLDWSNPSRAHPAGLVVGGLADGTVRVWDAASLIRAPRSVDDKTALVYSSPLLAGKDAKVDGSSGGHSAAVRAVQFNPFLQNLVASGAADGTVLVWDLSNPASGVSPRHPASKPGAPAATLPRSAASKDEISTVAWNRKVHNILSTASSAGVMNVWDLKQSRQVISIRNPRGRLRCSSLAWHPEIATQIVISCDEDDSTAAMLWDLRNATAPISAYTHHSPKGIVSLSWSTHDPDLLLTASKDSRTTVVSISTGELIVDTPPRGADWNFDVKWSPRIPGLYVASSFDGRLSVNSILSASSAPSVSSETATALAESFGANAGDFRSGMADQSPRTTDSQRVIYSIGRPPKWLKRPSTVSFFSLGGWKAHISPASTANGAKPASPQTVMIDSLTKEEVPSVSVIPDELDKMLMDLTSSDPSPAQQWCAEKANVASAKSTKDKLGWDILAILFGTDSRRKLIEYLGFSLPAKDVVDEIDMPVHGLLQSQPIARPVRSVPSDAPATGSVTTSTTATKAVDVNAITNGVGDMKMEGPAPWDVSDSFGTDEGKLDQDGSGSKGGSLLDGDDVGKPANGAKEDSDKSKSKPLFAGQSTTALELLIKRSVIVGDFRTAVDACLHLGKMADALVIAHAGGPDLWLHAQGQYLSKVSVSSGSKVIGAIAGPKTKLDEYIRQAASASADSWKEALAAILTYSPAEELYEACTALGNRLPKASDGALACFLCAYNVGMAVSTWIDPPVISGKPTTKLMAERVGHLTDVVERTRLLTAAVVLAQGETEIGAVRALDPVSGSILCEFAALLAFNGLYSAAVTYLSNLDPSHTCVYGSAEDLNQKASDCLALTDSSFTSNDFSSSNAGAISSTSYPSGAVGASQYNANSNSISDAYGYGAPPPPPVAPGIGTYNSSSAYSAAPPPAQPTPYQSTNPYSVPPPNAQASAVSTMNPASYSSPTASNPMVPPPPPPASLNGTASVASPPPPTPQAVGGGLPPVPTTLTPIRPGGVSTLGNVSGSSTSATVLPQKVGAVRPSPEPTSVYEDAPIPTNVATGTSNTMMQSRLPPPPIQPPGLANTTSANLGSYPPLVPVAPPNPVYPSSTTANGGGGGSAFSNPSPMNMAPPIPPPTATGAAPAPMATNALGQAMPPPPTLPPPPTDGDGPPPSTFYAKAKPGAGAKLPPSAEVAVYEGRRERAPSSSGTPGGPPRRSTSVSSSISALVTETVYLDKVEVSSSPDNQSATSIVKCLKTSFGLAQSANSSSMYRRKMEDINKRLGKLAVALNSGVVEEDVVSKLVGICKAIDSQNLQQAQQLLAPLSKEYWDTSRTWLQGLKWLLDCVAMAARR